MLIDVSEEHSASIVKINSMMQRFNCEAIISPPTHKFPSFYGKRMFITLFTRVGYWFLPRARGIQPKPYHYISLTPILILFSRLRLNLPKSSHYFSFANQNTFNFHLCMPHAPLISSSFWSLYQYLARSINRFYFHNFIKLVTLWPQYSSLCHIKCRLSYKSDKQEIH
jgi:hypothetical protein